MNRSILLLLSLAVLLTPPVSFAKSKAKKAAGLDPALVAKGKALFAVQCASCHGPKGQGDGAAAAALNPKPRNFTAGDWLKGTSVDNLFEMITKGVPGGPMVSYEGLPEADRRALASFVKSLK